MPDFTCQLSETGSTLTRFWEHTVGSDHAPVALCADWQHQLRRCHEGFRYVRFHGLLSDDMGTLISHQEKSLYSFFNADQICDFLLSIGMRPFVEMSFMPAALASGRRTVFHYRGNITPPRSYSFWTFSDIFEENYFPSKPFHGGFVLLNLHGNPKPAYRAFELLHSLGNESLLVDGLHETVDAWVVCGVNKTTVVLTNHALPRHHLAGGL